MKKFFAFSLSFLFFFAFSFSAFAGSDYNEIVPSVYGSVSPTSSVVPTLLGYVYNSLGKLPSDWIITRISQDEYRLYYVRPRNSPGDWSDAYYVTYRSNYSSSSSAAFVSGSLGGDSELADLKSWPRQYVYVGNVYGSVAYSDSISDFDSFPTFVILSLIAVLLIFLLFRRGYPGRCSF